MRIKVCGLRREEDARACARAGVDFAGLNFVPGSKRYLSLKFAKNLLPLMGSTQAVGIFRNASVEDVRRIARDVGLSWVQLHGDEAPEACKALSKEFSVIKALPLTALETPHVMANYAPFIQYFLIDGKIPGSGERWQWSQLNMRSLAGTPIFLAGGLNPENVPEAIRQAQPAGVDAATGLEKDGQLDADRIAAFTRHAREAMRELNP